MNDNKTITLPLSEYEELKNRLEQYKKALHNLDSFDKVVTNYKDTDKPMIIYCPSSIFSFGDYQTMFCSHLRILPLNIKETMMVNSRDIDIHYRRSFNNLINFFENNKSGLWRKSTILKKLYEQYDKAEKLCETSVNEYEAARLKVAKCEFDPNANSDMLKNM